MTQATQYGTVVESNEAIRCEYIFRQSSMQLTGKKISLNPQFEVVGEILQSKHLGS